MRTTWPSGPQPGGRCCSGLGREMLSLFRSALPHYTVGKISANHSPSRRKRMRWGGGSRPHHVSNSEDIEKKDSEGNLRAPLGHWRGNRPQWTGCGCMVACPRGQDTNLWVYRRMNFQHSNKWLPQEAVNSPSLEMFEEKPDSNLTGCLIGRQAPSPPASCSPAPLSDSGVWGNGRYSPLYFSWSYVSFQLHSRIMLLARPASGPVGISSPVNAQLCFLEQM